MDIRTRLRTPWTQPQERFRALCSLRSGRGFFRFVEGMRLCRDTTRRRDHPTRNPRPKRLGRLLRLFRTSYIFEPPQHFRRGAIHMLEHMFSHKRRCLLSGANKATSTTQDANRRVNGKVCHAKQTSGLSDSSEWDGVPDKRKKARRIISCCTGTPLCGTDQSRQSANSVGARGRAGGGCGHGTAARNHRRSEQSRGAFGDAGVLSPTYRLRHADARPAGRPLRRRRLFLHQFELSRLLYGKITGFFTLEDTISLAKRLR
jgi:hypothetical protein